MTAADLVDLTWKSALLAAGALILSVALRGYAPRYRAGLLQAALVGLLVLPVLALLLPPIELIVPAPIQSPGVAPEIGIQGITAPAIARANAFDLGEFALAVYVVGFVALLCHLAVNLSILAKLTRRGRAVTATEWRDTLASLRLARGMRDVDLRCSDEVGSPLSWGWIRPSIIIDPDSLRCPQLAEGVLAHELAHIARHDWPMMIVARVVLALYWFNPVVWLMVRRSVELTEQAADASAVRDTDRLAYARTLTQCARSKGMPQSALAIAASPDAVTRRIHLLIDDHVHQLRQGMTVPALAVFACAASGGVLASAQFKAHAVAPALFSAGPSIERQHPAVAWSSAALEASNPDSVANGTAARSVQNPMINGTSAGDPTHERPLVGLPIASGLFVTQVLDRQARGTTATKFGNRKTERGGRHTRIGDVMTQRGLSETTRGEILTRLGDVETKRGEPLTQRGMLETQRGEILTRLGDRETQRGEMQNRQAAASLRSENNGGPAP